MWPYETNDVKTKNRSGFGHACLSLSVDLNELGEMQVVYFSRQVSSWEERENDERQMTSKEITEIVVTVMLS